MCQASPAASTRLAALPSAISQRGRLPPPAEGSAVGGETTGFGCTQSPRSRSAFLRSRNTVGLSSPAASACAAARSTAASSLGPGSPCGNWR
ncbi:hypothetical protein B5P43_07720 [Bacillus sp. SRB_336]|nr:hypothetical protein B5P43_07720 [Bacillus sp. SRB_336]